MTEKEAKKLLESEHYCLKHLRRKVYESSLSSLTYEYGCFRCREEDEERKAIEKEAKSLKVREALQILGGQGA